MEPTQAFGRFYAEIVQLQLLIQFEYIQNKFNLNEFKFKPKSFIFLSLR